MNRSQNPLISYIFNIVAVMILIGSFWVYYAFTQTSKTIEEENLRSNLTYIDSVTSNIAQLITNDVQNNLYLTLKKDHALRHSLEKSLQLLVNSRYRYVYVVDKDSEQDNTYRFLLDGAKNEEDKSEFAERFTPLYTEVWQKAYSTQKPTYFQHTDTDAVWMTYLKPVVKNGEVLAIIAIDFSLQNHRTIMTALQNLNYVLVLALILGSVVFLVIVFFSILDKKRILQLQQKTAEISQLNQTLQDKVQSEVAKNREKEKQLIKQSRLAQMGEMLSMIAHQWRQPLAAISATSSNISVMIQLNKMDKEKLYALSEKISEYAQHLSTTIDDFRNFFKPNKEKKITDFNELTDAVLDIIGTSIENKNIKIVKKIENPEKFYTYPNEIKQVILNLLKNAEDVLIDKAIVIPVITIEINRNILRIGDNGGGIKEEIIDHIFDPYFSTKDEKTGTGLGLYMSKTIIEEHCDGKIYVKNGSEGAIFTIILDSEESRGE